MPSLENWDGGLKIFYVYIYMYMMMYMYMYMHKKSSGSLSQNHTLYTCTRTLYQYSFHAGVPGVIYSLSAGISLLGVELHQVADEILRRVGDGVPIGRVELIVSPHDLLEELWVTFMVEWRVATQSGGGGSVCSLRE